MKKIIVAAVASLAFATPALAQDGAAGTFTGFRLGVTGSVGGDDFMDFDGTTVGVEAGYDIETGGAVVGIGAEYQTDTDDLFDVRELGLVARAGGKVGQNALVYVSGGYSNLGGYGIHLDGVRVGVGAEFNIGTSGLNLKVEQRYANYEAGGELHQTVLGLGYRF